MIKLILETVWAECLVIRYLTGIEFNYPKAHFLLKKN